MMSLQLPNEGARDAGERRPIGYWARVPALEPLANRCMPRMAYRLGVVLLPSQELAECWSSCGGEEICGWHGAGRQRIEPTLR
eukprot:5364571-Amphidinium_carterae.4